MKTKVGKQILGYMAQQGKQGVTIPRLALETNIKAYKLRQIVGRYPDFFTKVGNEAKYTINCFGKHKGVIENMIIALAEENTQKKKRNFVYYIIGMSMFAVFIVNTVVSQLINQ